MTTMKTTSKDTKWQHKRQTMDTKLVTQNNACPLGVGGGLLQKAAANRYKKQGRMATGNATKTATKNKPHRICLFCVTNFCHQLFVTNFVAPNWGI